MNVFDLIWHLSGFIAPALFVASGVALVTGIFAGKNNFARGIWRQLGINFAVGLAVLVVGLVLTGHDGRMLTYVALVVAVATSQLVLGRR